MRKLSLYKALQLGYLQNPSKAKNRLKQFGYRLDPELSSKDRLVAYNRDLNKTIYITNGSETNVVKEPIRVLRDWTNNLLIPLDAFKQSDRYKTEKRIFDYAKKKYGDSKFTLVGHSQAGQTVNILTGKDDKGLTLDPALIDQKVNKNVDNYRVDGDVFSAFANDTKTLPDPVKSLRPFQPHDVENIKKQPIFV